MYEKFLIVTATCPIKWPQTKAVPKLQAEENQSCPLKGSRSFSSDCIIQMNGGSHIKLYLQKFKQTLVEVVFLHFPILYKIINYLNSSIICP